MEGWQKQKQSMDGFIPFSANVVTYQARALLSSGTYTVAQNVRDYRPGLKKRPGLEDLSPYVYGGPTVDLRPSHDEGGGDGSGDVGLHCGQGYGNFATNIRDSNPASNRVDPEDTATSMGPGVYGPDSESYARGRIGCQFNLMRYSYVTTITAASIFIRVVSATAQTNANANDLVRVVAAEAEYQFATCNGQDPWASTGLSDSKTGDVLLSDIAQLDPDDIIDPDGYILEIPLNAAGLTYLNEQLTANSGDGRVGFNLIEYDIDWLEDEQPDWTGHHTLNTRFDRYWPFLRMTFSDEPPSCISIFQYNQIRSGVTETLAYYANGDILSGYYEPPTPAVDTRLGPGDGDNSGYWPYSDGLPSDYRGYENVRGIAPAYDSKWGSFVYREGGDNWSTLDWDQCYEDAVIDETPPSWGILDDILIVADGRGLAKFYGGQGGQPCKASVMVIDPSDQGINTDTGIFQDVWDSDGVVMSFPGSATQNSYFYIYTPILTDEYLITINTANSGTGTVLIDWWSGTSWVSVDPLDVIDTTRAVAGKSFGQDGSLYAADLLSNKPQRLYGLSGYWTRFQMTSTSVSFNINWKAKYSFQSLTNVWDGVLVDAVEAKHFDASAGASGIYVTYANTAIDVSLMATDDWVYFSTKYVPRQVYINVGSTPNTGSPVGTLSFKYWNGANWTTWTVVDDQTNGLTQSGFVTLATNPVSDTYLGSQKQAFQGSLFGTHWFRMATSQVLGDNMRISIQYEPILNMSDFGDNTECATVWKERAVYSFDKYPSWIYITRNGTVNVLNGEDYGVLQAGDGRRHSIKSMKKFHNELMVWQEEKGADGGCLTLFEGYSPSTFGKLLLSAKIGTLNANTTIVIDGALEASRTDYAAATVAYFLSNYGVFMSDGQTVVSISAAIQNYFDPENADCIRNGYQDLCWLAHDPTHQVLRMGLVSGASATQPNIFPVYDLITKRWSFDAYATEHTIRCMTETSGDSSVSAVQVSVAAGTKLGKIFNASSTNLNDDGDTAIDMQVRIEFNHSGHLLELNELAIRIKRQSAGICLFTVYENGVYNAGYDKTVDMTTGKTTYPQVGATEENVVERLTVGVKQEDSISVSFQNAIINEDMYLYDYWIDMDRLVNR